MHCVDDLIDQWANDRSIQCLTCHRGGIRGPQEDPPPQKSLGWPLQKMIKKSSDLMYKMCEQTVVFGGRSPYFGFLANRKTAGPEARQGRKLALTQRATGEWSEWYPKRG